MVDAVRKAADDGNGLASRIHDPSTWCLFCRSSSRVVTRSCGKPLCQVAAIPGWARILLYQELTPRMQACLANIQSFCMQCMPQRCVQKVRCIEDFGHLISFALTLRPPYPWLPVLFGSPPLGTQPPPLRRRLGAVAAPPAEAPRVPPDLASPKTCCD